MASRNCLICGSPTARDGATGRRPDYCGPKCREIAARRKKPLFRRLDFLNAEIAKFEAEDDFLASLKFADGRTTDEVLIDLRAERDHLERELFG